MKTTPHPEPLTVEDVAMVLGDIELREDTWRRLRDAVRTDPRMSEPVAALEAMARDAGIEIQNDDDFWYALRAHQLFDMLLAAEGWEHPAEVIAEEGELEPYFDELLHVARARAGREPDSRRLAEVREKLEEARAGKRRSDALVEGFAQQLLTFEPAVAEHLLRRAAREYELRAQQARPRRPADAAGPAGP